MSTTRRSIIGTAEAALQAAGVRVLESGVDVVVRSELPCAWVDWTSESADDSSTDDAGGSIDVRRIEVAVSAAALTSDGASALADQCEEIIAAALPDCDFVSAEISRSGVQEGDAIFYTVRSTFSALYERRLAA